MNIRLLTFAIAALIFVQCGKKEESAPSIESKVDSALQQPSADAAPASEHTAPAEIAPAIGSDASAGEKLFKNTTLGKIKASCATCHSTGGSDSRLRAGHTLAGVTKRTATWNGMFKGTDLEKNAYGGSLCSKVFQERAGGLKPDEVTALNEYLKSLEAAPGAVTKNITIQWAAKPTLSEDEMVDEKIAKPIVKALLRIPGDAGAGEKVFARACAVCHSFTDKVVGPKLTADVAGDAELLFGAIRFGFGPMPYFAKDILSDQQVADVVAYIQATAK